MTENILQEHKILSKLEHELCLKIVLSHFSGEELNGAERLNKSL